MVPLPTSCPPAQHDGATSAERCYFPGSLAGGTGRLISGGGALLSDFFSSVFGANAGASRFTAGGKLRLELPAVGKFDVQHNDLPFSRHQSGKDMHFRGTFRALDMPQDVFFLLLDSGARQRFLYGHLTV